MDRLIGIRELPSTDPGVNRYIVTGRPGSFGYTMIFRELIQLSVEVLTQKR